jgi:hypothetical protein
MFCLRFIQQNFHIRKNVSRGIQMKLKLDSTLAKIFAEAIVKVPPFGEEVIWWDTKQVEINGKDFRVWLEDKTWYVEVPDDIFKESKPKELPAKEPITDLEEFTGAWKARVSRLVNRGVPRATAIADVRKAMKNKEEEVDPLEKYDRWAKTAINKRVKKGMTLENAIKDYEKARKVPMRDIAQEVADAFKEPEIILSTPTKKINPVIDSQAEIAIKRMREKEERAKREKIDVFKLEDIMHTVTMRRAEWDNRYAFTVQELSTVPIIIGTLTRWINAKTGEVYSTPSVGNYRGGLSVIVSGESAPPIQNLPPNTMLQLQLSIYTRTVMRMRLYMKRYANPTQVRKVDMTTTKIHGNPFYQPKVTVKKVFDSEEKLPVGLKNLVPVEEMLLPFADENVQGTWVLDKSELQGNAKIVFNSNKVSKAGIKVGQYFAVTPLGSDKILHSTVLRKSHSVELGSDIIKPLFANRGKCVIIFSKLMAKDSEKKVVKPHEGVLKSLIMPNPIDDGSSKLFGE